MGMGLLSAPSGTAKPIPEPRNFGFGFGSAVFGFGSAVFGFDAGGSLLVPFL